MFNNVIWCPFIDFIVQQNYIAMGPRIFKKWVWALSSMDVIPCIPWHTELNLWPIFGNVFSHKPEVQMYYGVFTLIHLVCVTLSVASKLLEFFHLTDVFSAEEFLVLCYRMSCFKKVTTSYCCKHCAIRRSNWSLASSRPFNNMNIHPWRPCILTPLLSPVAACINNQQVISPEEIQPFSKA
jgi:hypothetical protein